MSHLLHATDHIYSNTASGLTATDTQAAIDEVAAAQNTFLIAASGGSFTSVATATDTGAAGDHFVLASETFTETSTINIKSDMWLEGQGIDKTIIDIDATEILMNGTSIAGNGAISITSSAVTGVGANLTGFAIGDLIEYNGQLYTLATITDANTATIEEHVGKTSGALSAWFGLDISNSRNRIIIRDMTILTNSSTAFGWLLRADGGRGCLFERVKFQGNFNVTQGLFRTIGLMEATFKDCIFETSDARGLRFENRCLDMEFENCQWISNGTGASDWDVEILRAPGTKFTKCTFSGGGDSAIKTSVGPVQGIKVDNCTFLNKGDHPIEFDTTTAGFTVLDTTISDCTFKDCAGNGIYINSGGGINITGNTIVGQTLDGVQIDNAAANVDVVITGNTIRNNGAFGVDNDHTLVDVLTVQANNLRNNSSGGLADAAASNNTGNNQT